MSRVSGQHDDKTSLRRVMYYSRIAITVSKTAHLELMYTAHAADYQPAAATCWKDLVSLPLKSIAASHSCDALARRWPREIADPQVVYTTNQLAKVAQAYQTDRCPPNAYAQASDA